MSDKLVTIATFYNPIEASIARGQLEDGGVKVFLAEEATVGIAWHLTGAIGGVKLQVMESEADRAISILESNDGETVEDVGFPSDVDEGSDEQDTTVQAAEAREDMCVDPADAIVRRALLVAVLGVMWTPLLFYSAWLLGKIKRKRYVLHSVNRRRYVIASVITAVAFILHVLLITTMYLRMYYR